ncbi:MAG TPA: transcriptional repressor [Solirubrobacteraceae bacterium]|nr:transcriptional repressor [Solirubrobacteraceae bacterium]
MTISPAATPLPVSSLADALSALRERGLRVSSTRRLMLQALLDADAPVSAENVARRLELDSASVHRNLETLERHGLVRHVHLGHGPGLYAMLGGGEREYLHCERCGATKALAPKELDPVRRRIRERYGYEARFSHFPIVGLCSKCAGSDEAGA